MDITVSAVESADGRPCLTAGWLLPVEASGSIIVETLARLDDAIYAHAISEDLHVRSSKVTARHYYRTAAQAKTGRGHMTQDLHEAAVVAVRAWRAVEA